MGWSTPQGPLQWWLVLAGWSVLVVLWHSTIIALLFAVWRLRRPAAPPQRHYALAVAAIATALVLAVVTPVMLAHQTATATPPRVTAAGPGGTAGATPQPMAPAGLAATDAATVASTAGVRLAMWWVGAAWAAGCAAMALRLISGLMVVSWIRRRAQPSRSGAVIEAVAHTSGAWRLAPPGVLSSVHIDAPVALGFRRPVVVLPHDAEQRLPTAVLGPLLEHELAHIQRHDYAVNLAQSIADAVLFFSPGARWMSRCAREAREFCCDDLAVGRCGGPGSYARALVALAGLGVESRASLALDATGPRLIVRIRRLLREESMPRHPRRHIAGVVALLALATAGGRGLVTASAAGVGSVVVDSPVAQPPATMAAPPTRFDAPAIETMMPIPYPDDARAAGVQGPVILAVTTDTLGQPSNVAAVAGEPVLTAPAIEAVGQWRFAVADEPRTFLLGVNVMPRDPSLSMVQTAPIRVGGPVKPPSKIAHVNPVYPGEARDARVQGVVIMQARIGTDGIVDAAVVLRSVPGLDEAALLSVVQWQYAPTLLNGVAVPVSMTVTVNFTLQ